MTEKRLEKPAVDGVERDFEVEVELPISKFVRNRSGQVRSHLA